MKSNRAGKTYVRSFLIGATIITVLILHFAVSQVFFVEESAQGISVNELIVEEPAIIKPENEAEKTETINMTEAVSSSAQPEPEVEVKQPIGKETETVERKKPPRESKAQRLRRAEKILTGI
jgi:outer membrane biosynthesis protein TonB